MDQYGQPSHRKLRIHDGNSVTYPRRMYVDNNRSEMPHEFNCTELVHFTENEFARSIGELGTDQPFRFQAFPYDVDSNTKTLHLTWWAARRPDNWREAIIDGAQNNKLIGTSPAIDGKPLCGPIGFVVSWRDILEQYAVGRQKNLNDVELRIFTTDLFIKEIMFSILVCLKG